MSIGICVLTLNGAHHLHRCLPPLLASPLKPRLLVVDSSSTDGSEEMARKMGTETCCIPRSDFNHGLTREMARRMLSTDIVLMVTQDAYAADENVVETLAKPILEKKASAAYGRQLPHAGAGFFEAFHRHFNYPNESDLRRLQDLERIGRQIYFCSNSFAAYSNMALDEIGGFQKVLLGEDTVAVARLLKKGHTVAYVAEAEVYHSHNYTLLEEFKRHFDTGFARESFAHELAGSEGDSAKGKAYAKELMKKLAVEAPHLLPYGCLLLSAKWAGYKLGKWGHAMPSWWNRLFSGHKVFFTSD